MSASFQQFLAVWELQEHSKGASRFLLAHHKREEEALKK